MSAEEGPKRRLTAEQRREQILAAATEVFGALGAAGTTDAIARRAGISQAYVVRTFGSKEQLLLEVAGRAASRIEATFREAIAGFGDGTTVDHKIHVMGDAYKRLMMDRGLLLSLRHIYTLGADPVVGPAAREGFLGIYRLIRDEAGLGSQDTMRFMAHGMLIDTLLAMRLTDSNEPDARELAACALEIDESELTQLRGIAGSVDDFLGKR